MRAIDIIVKKRDGHELSREEINFFIQGFTHGEIPDYQASAWTMAILLRGMNNRETYDLTHAMAASGEQLDLASIVPGAVDKHSTGGVGDKTTLVVQPIVASCGVPMGKMSGRGLSFSGGTLDKMESIPGFRVDLTTNEFVTQFRDIGMVLSGQTLDLAPADGKLYALRDASGTVPSIPLIASSIMSKKIAAGSTATLLDVKVGSGAFMHSLEQASALSQTMVSIGEQHGMKMKALISDMNQPLGHAIGNALEVREAIETLLGGGPMDFREHCLVVAENLLLLAGAAKNNADARRKAEQAVSDGSALAKFRVLVEAQGGDVGVVDDPDQLPKAEFIETAVAPKAGYLRKIDALEVGMATVLLGGGRAKKQDPIQHEVGVVVHNKVGDLVEEGNPLFTVHASEKAKLKESVDRLYAAHEIVDEQVEPLPLFYKTA